MKGSVTKNKVIPYSPQDQIKELERGTVDIIPKELFITKLEASYQTQTPLKIKFGADPSAPDIHLGHTVVLYKLKQFQDFGHKIDFLIGDFTSQIGDPTGKNKTRPHINREEVKKNATTYQTQIGKILDLKKTHVIFNSTWWETLSLSDCFHLFSKVTVQGITHRDDFSERLKKNQPIYMHEFLYPLMQAYDSVKLKSDIEIGGTDQIFNMLMGRNLQKAFHFKEAQVIFTLPLLEGLDGVHKMSKSLGNAISIQESPKNIFGKIMSLSDKMMIRYYLLLSQKNLKEIKELLKKVKSKNLHPMEAKKQLAEEITSHYYGREVAKKERRQFENRFSKRKIPQDILCLEKKEGEISLIQSFKEELNWCTSNSEVRRLIRQNAVKVNGKLFKKENLLIQEGKEYIISAGKLRIAKIKVPKIKVQ